MKESCSDYELVKKLVVEGDIERRSSERYYTPSLPASGGLRSLSTAYRKLLSSLLPSSRKSFPPSGGRHPRTKSMYPCSLFSFWFISEAHKNLLLLTGD